MNEFEEVKIWYQKADDLLCSLTTDKTANILLVASLLRHVHIEGKSDGVRDWNNSPR